MEVCVLDGPTDPMDLTPKPKKTEKVTVYLTEELRAKLESIKDETGHARLGALMTQLLEEAVKDWESKKGRKK